MNIPPAEILGSFASAAVPYDTFIPGFRDGKVTACRFTLPVLFNDGQRVTTLN